MGPVIRSWLRLSVVLVILNLLNLGLGILLISVSGFILQGVNNTGPMLPEAMLYVAMIVVCFAVPLIVWAAHNVLPKSVSFAIAALPLAISAAVLLSEPYFVK